MTKNQSLQQKTSKHDALQNVYLLIQINVLRH